MGRTDDAASAGAPRRRAARILVGLDPDCQIVLRRYLCAQCLTAGLSTVGILAIVMVSRLQGSTHRATRSAWAVLSLLGLLAGRALTWRAQVIQAPPPGQRRSLHSAPLLHRALKDAARWGYVPHNRADDVDPPHGASPQQQVWTPEQLRAFLAHVRGDRLYALWLLVATTGMRRAELAGLRWSDIDFARARLTPRLPGWS